MSTSVFSTFFFFSHSKNHFKVSSLHGHFKGGIVEVTLLIYGLFIIRQLSSWSFLI